MHRAGAARRGRRGVGSTAAKANRPSSARTCCWRSAASRTPTTSASTSAGVETDARGYIPVDDRLATNVPGIWALGDCNGRGAFTHTAYNDFEIVAANLLDGEQRSVSDRVPGYALYIDPPLGRVGMTEAQARESGRPLLVGNAPHDQGRPRGRERRDAGHDESRRRRRDSKKILGAAILGTGGDEAIHGILDIMNAGATYPELQWAVPIHPTVSELIPTLLGDMRPA